MGIARRQPLAHPLSSRKRGGGKLHRPWVGSPAGTYLDSASTDWRDWRDDANDAAAALVGAVPRTSQSSAFCALSGSLSNPCYP